jgi:alpha-tubulin suppressor-like RCC1 family protein
MQVGSLTDWYYVLSAGYDAFEMSIKKDGTLWTWGQNTYGELALNNRTQYSSPKQVGALTNWLQVASGGYGILAIKTDGTLWGWGNPSVYGSLGLGNTSYYSSPKQVGSLTNWKTISKSYFYFSLAIKTDGTLWSWGYNGYGQLGIGNLTNYSSPKQVGALTTWSSVTAGYNQTLAIKTDGTLWGWGSNAYGQIGDGTRTSKSSPVQIGALTTWLSVSGGGYFSVALKTDGTLWSWGYNATGSLGLGNTTYYSSPKQVGSLTTWSKLNTNSNSGLVAAIKTDGTLWTWGNNAQGQLGLGNRTNYSSPKQVGSLTTWLSVSCGVYTIIALG